MQPRPRVLSDSDLVNDVRAALRGERLIHGSPLGRDVRQVVVELARLRAELACVRKGRGVTGGEQAA